ncbi:YfaP family protein [Aquabacterium sp.]|uniref:YfaP family protein n=1 Tax=Aquabacterium sp. TaxID=1872578 RepID=UPI0037836EC1
MKPMPNHHAFCALALLTAVGLATPARAQVRLDTPMGGWRAAPTQQQDFLQEVHYPAASVNSNRRSAAALIQGQIAQTPKAAARDLPKSGEGEARQPGRLVVDGIALPLEIGEDGRFSRPWSFGAGAHGLTVRAPGPQGAATRVQFIEANRDRGAVKLRVVLSWDSDNTDLDLHVVSPDGQHVFYGNRVAPNGGALDVDVTTGFGPEIFAHPAPPAGTWHVYVNYYGAGERRDVITVAQVAIIENEGTGAEKQQTFRVPMRKPGELTLVRSFVMP